MGRKVRYDDKVQVTSGMSILEDIALVTALVGQVFIIYLFFDMLAETKWWISLGSSLLITTAIYYTIKYIVNWLHSI
jgi:signal transduction histidine kinase